MAIVYKNIIPPKQAEATQVGQYTVTSGKTVIDKFTATNTSASNVSISVNLVRLSGTAADSNLIVKTKILAPSETYTFPELIGHVLETGSFISTIAGAATSITIMGSGREIS